MNFELEIVIRDIANTVPGIAYPMLAGKIINFKNKFLFWRIDKERIREKIIASKDAHKPKLIVLNVRVNNSIVNPLCIWSKFIKNHKHGIPIEKIGGNKENINANRALFFFNSHP